MIARQLAGATSVRGRLGALRRVHPANWALGLLVVAGVALRVAAAAAIWPVTTTLADSGVYTSYAIGNPMADPLHTAGYASFLATIGLVSHDVAFLTIVQHVLGVVTGLLFYAAVRRLTGSRWTALVPAAVVLLNADLAFLERNVVSEPLFLAVLATVFYATVRAFDDPSRRLVWPVAAGTLVGLLTVVRVTAVFLLPIVVGTIFMTRQGSLRQRSLAPLSAAAVGVLILLLYSTGNLISNDRFELGPTQGYHLYGRVASFADCRQFTPPAGTRALCETVPIAQRPNGSYYMYDPRSPLIRAFGSQPYLKHDSDLRAFALQAIIHQPHYYAKAMWGDLKSYFAPNTLAGSDLDGELDWNRAMLVYEPGVQGLKTQIERFFNPFADHASPRTVKFLHDYQRIFRFGATLLVICSLLTAVGLLVGPRRSRLGVGLFGLGGLALLAPPVLSVFYVSRYEIPVSAPLAAAAAISVLALARMERARAAGDRSA